MAHVKIRFLAFNHHDRVMYLFQKVTIVAYYKFHSQILWYDDS